MENTALITGANGFIGSHLACKLVEDGFKIFAVSRQKNSKNPTYNKYVNDGKIEFISGDVRTIDVSALPKNIDYVFHIAGKVSAWGKLEEFMQINYEGTKKFLEWSKKASAKCFVYFSSTAVYGYNGYINLKEDAPKTPFNNPYSISKLKTEQMVATYAKELHQDYVVVRPGNVYGEYDYTSSHEIYTRIKKEKMLISAGGKYKSCFVYVKNLVDAVVVAAKNKEAHNTDYNITDGNNETLKEMFTAIANEFGVRAKFVNFPAPMAKATARIVEFVYHLFRIKKAPLITKFSVWQNCADYSFDISKIKSIGFKAQYNQTQAIKNTCDWINSLGDIK